MTNAEAWFNKSLRPWKPEGSLRWTAQDSHLDSHRAPELCHPFFLLKAVPLMSQCKHISYQEPSLFSELFSPFFCKLSLACLPRTGSLFSTLFFFSSSESCPLMSQCKLISHQEPTLLSSLLPNDSYKNSNKKSGAEMASSVKINCCFLFLKNLPLFLCKKTNKSHQGQPLFSDHF